MAKKAKVELPRIGDVVQYVTADSMKGGRVNHAAVVLTVDEEDPTTVGLLVWWTGPRGAAVITPIGYSKVKHDADCTVGTWHHVR